MRFTPLPAAPFRSRSRSAIARLHPPAGTQSFAEICTVKRGAMRIPRYYLRGSRLGRESCSVPRGPLPDRGNRPASRNPHRTGPFLMPEQVALAGSCHELHEFQMKPPDHARNYLFARVAFRIFPVAHRTRLMPCFCSCVSARPCSLRRRRMRHRSATHPWSTGDCCRYVRADRPASVPARSNDRGH